MNTTKLLTVLVAALVVSAGAGAVTATDAENSVEAPETTVEASYDNGTVTLSVTQNGTGVENVSVTANGEDVGATDANGTLTFETDATEELEIELEGEELEHEIEYVIEDGELVREADDDDDEDENALAADVTYDNGTVDLTVTQNGSAVENASVAANGENVGTTDANGTLTFETNATEELEIVITSGEQELELEYAIEDGELVRESDDDDEAGPDENASDRAHAVFGAIQNWLDNGQEGSLGQLIQDTLDNGNDDASGNSDAAPGNSGDAPGNSDEAPGNSGEAPGHSDDESDESETESDDEADEEEADDDDEEDDGDEEDEDDEENDGNPGKGNGNN